MGLKLYNSLTRQIEAFSPLDTAGGRVTFYSCGPTVYDYAHIGNFRSFLNADLLRRTLELVGHEVVHVMNMTDVGHMTEDDGSGEDRMGVARSRLLEAKKSGTLPLDAREIDPNDPYAIADFYVEAFLADARRLGLKVAHEAEDRPELMPRPTRYVKQMVALVEQLIEKRHAYVGADGTVYFDVRSFPEYGRLSGNTLDALREAAGGRIRAEHQAAKRNPADFMLWKPDRSHLMRWPSPWGEGYPGWHLECSVMAVDLLGQDTDGVIDIHSGGEDNIFPHHECEIAQSRSASGAAHFARLWFHTRHLIVEGEKMSKSKGNFFTLSDLMAKGASPAAVRLELTKTHYRDNANFTFRGLHDVQRQIDRWTRAETHLADPATARPGALTHAIEEFTRALCNDLNVAGAMGALNKGLAHYSIEGATAGEGGPAGNVVAGPASDELRALRRMLETLGVLDLERAASSEDDEGDKFIESRITERNQAREDRDWATSDRIRDELASMGVALHDGPEGTTWKRVVKERGRH